MIAQVLERPRSRLQLADYPVPTPGSGEVVLRVEACGVCRTDLHLLDGELEAAKLPLVLGHQIVGRVCALGEGVATFARGDRVGVPWLAWTCGECDYCASESENLCDDARFTGCHVDGGFAEYAAAGARYAFPLPGGEDPSALAPLLCGGLIGYRALTMAGEARRLGLYGFGSAAHVIAQVARHQGRDVFAFTRPGDGTGQALAIECGAAWAGGSDKRPPAELDAALVFAPVGELVHLALRAVRKGGVVVCAGIHMSDIAFPYEALRGERVLRSVANLTRRDAEEFLALAARVRIQPVVERFPLVAANEALSALRAGKIRGSAVLVPGAP